MSSTDGSPTNTGWKRRASAASFSMCLRYSSSVVAPMQCSVPRASSGLIRFDASIEPSARPAPTRLCSSSMNRMISPCARLDLLQHGLQPFLELAAVFRAGDHRAQVERQQLLVLQRLRHVAVDDAHREALDDRGLADAGLADQHRVVLGAAGQHLDGAADFLVAADHRVELALARQRGDVAGVFLQRVEVRLGVRAVDLAALADVVDRLVQRLRRDARHCAARAPAGVSEAASATSSRSCATYSSPALVAACCAASSTRTSSGVICGWPAPAPCTLGMARELGLDRGQRRPSDRRRRPGSGRRRRLPHRPAAPSADARGVICWWNSRIAMVCAACRKPRDRSVNFSMSMLCVPVRRRLVSTPTPDQATET